MELEVRALSSHEVGEGAALLVRAFAADPILTHLLGDPRRRIAHQAFFRAAIRDHLDEGHVYGGWDGGKIVGVAVWAPPKGADPTPHAPRRVDLDAWLVRLLFPRGERDIGRLFGSLAPLHPAEAHWYLAFVGVDPERQGQGIGGRLLSPVLTLADQTATLCYLETPSAAVLGFYRRLGFEVVSEVKPIPRLDAPVWTMVRVPQPVSAAL